MLDVTISGVLGQGGGRDVRVRARRAPRGRAALRVHEPEREPAALIIAIVSVIIMLTTSITIIIINNDDIIIIIIIIIDNIGIDINNQGRGPHPGAGQPGAGGKPL